MLALQLSSAVHAMDDAPFPQWTSDRYLTGPNDATRIAGWPLLAVPVPFRVKFSSSGSRVLLLTNKTLLCCPNASNLTNSLAAVAVPGASLSEMVIADDTVAISHSDGRLSIVECNNFCSCQVVASIAGAIGVHDGANTMLWRSGSSRIWLGSNTGLFAYRFASGRLSMDAAHINPCELKNQTASSAVYGLSFIASFDMLVASTESCVAFLNTSTSAGSAVVELARRVWNGGVIDGAARCMGFSVGSRRLWAVTNSSLNSFSLIEGLGAVAGVWDRIAAGALPYSSCAGGMAMTMGDGGGQDEFWIGTTHGLVHHRRSNSNSSSSSSSSSAVFDSESAFEVYSGSRWLPTTSGSVAVTSVAASRDGDLVVATTASPHGPGGALQSRSSGGVAVLRRHRGFTLSHKAAHFQRAVPRHIRPTTGLVSALPLQRFGELGSARRSAADDNHGLWTADFLAAQSWRCSASARAGDAHGAGEARQLAVGALSALEGLVNVTGVEGYPARTMVASVAERDRHPSHWGWNPSPSRSGWWFMGNTSSDEITGHVFGLSAFLDCRGCGYSDAERGRARALLRDMTMRIVASGFVVVDVTGRVTRWGRFDPRELNDDPAFAEDQRGLNSLQILSFLLSAARHTNSNGSDAFTAAADGLVAAGYALNMLSQTVTAPSEINFSDNDLAFKPYYTMAAACGWLRGLNTSAGTGTGTGTGTTHARGGQTPTPAPAPAPTPELTRLCRTLRPFFRQSIERTMRVIGGERAALYNAIYGLSTMPASADEPSSGSGSGSGSWLSDALATLREYPLELIRWPADNTQRLDLPPDPAMLPLVNRSVRAIPRYESVALRWCNDPFSYTGSPPGTGMQEEDPTFWHMPYWMMRHHSLI